MPVYTVTEQKILDLLSDGKLHRAEEIHACLPDELGARENIHQHLSNIRKKLRAIGQDIVLRRNGLSKTESWYYHCRVVASPYDGSN